MDILILYLLVAISTGLTSYITIYRPALYLYEEITEDYSSIQSKILYKLVWTATSVIIAPIVAALLLRGQNEKYIKEMTLYWLEEDVDE